VHWLSLGLPVKCLNIFVFRQEAVSAARAVFQSVRNEYRNGLPAARAKPVYDFFVSYARDNEAAAQGFVSRLESSDLSVFVDQAGVQVGSMWQHEIFMALEKSRQVICLLSPSYLESDYCLEEFNIALLRDRSLGGRVLVPVLLYTTQLPVYMQIRQFLDAREGSDQRINEICSQLASRAVELQVGT
jgi:hypothetical protein